MVGVEPNVKRRRYSSFTYEEQKIEDSRFLTFEIDIMGEFQSYGAWTSINEHDARQEMSDNTEKISLDDSPGFSTILYDVFYGQ